MIDKFKDQVKFNVEKRDVDGDKTSVYHVTAQIGFGGDRYSVESEIEASKEKLLEDLEKMFLTMGVNQDFVNLVFQAGYEQGTTGEEIDIPPMSSFIM